MSSAGQPVAGKDGEGDPPRRRHRLRRRDQHGRPQHRLRHLPRRAAREIRSSATGSSPTPASSSGRPRGSVFTARRATPSRRTSRTTTRTRASSSSHGLQQQPRREQRDLQQRRPRHRQLRQSTGQRLIANSVYKNVTAGINVEGSSTGATIANNISVDNGIASPRTRSNIRVDSASTSGTTMDYDLVYLSSPDVMLIWNSVNYTSLAAFKSATGQETHGIQADPKWASPGAGDFHLTAGSPAIDSANSGASGQPSCRRGRKPPPRRPGDREHRRRAPRVRRSGRLRVRRRRARPHRDQPRERDDRRRRLAGLHGRRASTAPATPST